MKYHVLVGTYHKTGSVWMYNVFSQLAGRIGVPFRHITAHTSFFKKHLKDREGVDRFFAELGETDRPHIVFDGMSRFGHIESGAENRFRGFRVVRWPVAVICSAARYHCWSEEPWLQVPRQDLDGRTYQDVIKSLASDNERYRFEMSHSSLNTIRHMANFDRQGYVRTVRYEDLMQDASMALFSELLAYLGFDDNEVSEGLESFHENSLFGRLDPGKEKHIQAADQSDYGFDWDERTRALYREDIAGLAERIGYP